jgi:predicted DNA-binding transcriptional regulator YafY
MKEAMLSLSELVLKIQGDGDYETARKMIEEKGFIREELQKDLDRIGEAGIPRDIVFEQGAEILGIK